jgi:hypothetical protein
VSVEWTVDKLIYNNLTDFLEDWSDITKARITLYGNHKIKLIYKRDGRMINKHYLMV